MLLNLFVLIYEIIRRRLEIEQENCKDNRAMLKSIAFFVGTSNGMDYVYNTKFVQVGSVFKRRS